MPENSGLTTEGICSLLMFVFMVSGMVSGCFNGTSFTCVMTVIAMCIVGVADVKTIWNGFSGSMFFLAFGISMVAVAMDHTSVPQRFTVLAIKLSRGNSRLLVSLLC